MCVIRYGNDGLKITAIQSAAWYTPAASMR
jgi:hypothetical protein